MSNHKKLLAGVPVLLLLLIPTVSHAATLADAINQIQSAISQQAAALSTLGSVAPNSSAIGNIHSALWYDQQAVSALASSTGTVTITSSYAQATSTFTVAGTVSGVPTYDGIIVFLMPASYTNVGTYTGDLGQLGKDGVYENNGGGTQPTGAWTAQFAAVDVGSYRIDVFDAATKALLTSPDRPLVVSYGVASTSKLISAGVYQATNATSNFCYHNYGTITVNVPSSSSPLILSLSAYEPTHWKVVIQPGAIVKKVILGGYGPQTVYGVPGATIQKHFFENPSNTSSSTAVTSTTLAQGSFYDDRDTTGTIYGWAGSATCAGSSALVPLANRHYFNGSSDYYYDYPQGNASAKLTNLTGLPVSAWAGAASAATLTFTSGSVLGANTTLTDQIASVMAAIDALKAQLGVH